MKKHFFIALLCLIGLSLPAFADSQYEQLERLGVQIPNRVKTSKLDSLDSIERQRNDFYVNLERKWCEEHWAKGEKDVTWDMVNGKCVVPNRPEPPQIVDVYLHNGGIKYNTPAFMYMY